MSSLKAGQIFEWFDIMNGERIYGENARISDGEGRKYHDALFKVAKIFKKSKQTKQQKRICNNICTTKNIMVAIHKSLKLDERTENNSVAVEG